MTVYYQMIKSFNRHAAEYESAAKVQQEIGQRLFERLSYLNITPKRILDLGCGPGCFSRELRRLFPKAQVIGLDFAQEMLNQAKAKHRWRCRWSLVNADMRKMPFPSGTFDLVFANQVIHWGLDITSVFRELNRVMNQKACLMFTTLGPDTFKELKRAWAGVNDHAHVNEFADMHDIGDSLVAEYFLEPVMDMEWLVAHYETPMKIVKALKAQGVKNINSGKNQGLTGQSSWAEFERCYEVFRTESGKYPLTYEVVYGHAWKGEQRRTDKGIETMIPISQMTRLKK